MDTQSVIHLARKEGETHKETLIPYHRYVRTKPCECQQRLISRFKQRIFERTQPDYAPSETMHKELAEKLEPEIVDSASENMPIRITPEPSVKRVESSTSVAREKK